jgi:hypothetical protein
MYVTVLRRRTASKTGDEVFMKPLHIVFLRRYDDIFQLDASVAVIEGIVCDVYMWRWYIRAAATLQEVQLQYFPTKTHTHEFKYIYMHTLRCMWYGIDEVGNNTCIHTIRT